MKKVFEFGKVSAEGKNKSNLVTIEVELRESSKGPVLSMSGNVWDRRKYDIVQGGQCIDDVWEEFGSQLKNKDMYKELMGLWEKYHLNDMNAGTPAQSEAIKNWEAAGNRYDYTAVCEYLKSIDLYEDKGFLRDGVNGYKYGSAWLYREIPEADLKRIKELLA